MCFLTLSTLSTQGTLSTFFLKNQSPAKPGNDPNEQHRPE